MPQSYDCSTVEKHLRQVVLDYTTKINNLVCIVNQQKSQIKLDCISCVNGIPVFKNIKNSFALATDSNGQVITATNVYNKTEVDELIQEASINIGNSNLTLTGNRTLNGGGYNFTTQGISTLTLKSNNSPIIQSDSEDFITFGTTGGDVIYLKKGGTYETQTLITPDIDQGTIATEEYVDKYRVFPLTSDNTGKIQSSSLIGKNIGLIQGGSLMFENGYQFYKTINGDTILDQNNTGQPFIFIPTYKYYLTPI